MTTPRLVRGYLDELRSTAADRLGPVRSAELVDEIHEHIDAAIASGQPVGDVLERLGSPAEIVAAEPHAGQPAGGPRLRARELFAIVLLLIGLPLLVVGWVVGVVLLWTSDRWSTRDKLVGTLLWPGGLGLFLAVGLSPTTMTTQTCDGAGSCSEVSSSSIGLGPWLGGLLAAVLIIVPIATSIHLARAAAVPPRQ